MKPVKCCSELSPPVGLADVKQSRLRRPINRRPESRTVEPEEPAPVRSPPPHRGQVPVFLDPENMCFAFSGILRFYFYLFLKNVEPFEVSFPLIIIKAGKAEKADPRPGCKNAYQRQEKIPAMKPVKCCSELSPPVGLADVKQSRLRRPINRRPESSTVEPEEPAPVRPPPPHRGQVPVFLDPGNMRYAFSGILRFYFLKNIEPFKFLFPLIIIKAHKAWKKN